MTNELLNVNQIVFFGVELAQIGTVVLMLIMVTMGSTLTTADFRYVLVAPKPVLIGLVAQLLFLPLLAFGLVFLVQPALPIAMGLIILSCCPSGATSNFFSHLAKGNVALSISLTALSGVIVVFTIPLIVNLATSLLAEKEQRVYLEVLPAMVRIFTLIILPVFAGILFRYYQPVLAVATEPYATKILFVALVSTMILVLVHVWPLIDELVSSAGVIVLSLNLIMMLLGFVIARFHGLGESDSRTICVEVGVQNYLLSIVIALSLLETPAYAIVPIVYLFVMYVTVFSFISYCRFYRDKTLLRISN